MPAILPLPFCDFLGCHSPCFLVPHNPVKDSSLRSVVTALSTAIAVLAGISSVSAQTVRVGNPGFYQACIVRPEFMGATVMKPEFIRPQIEKPDLQAKEIVRPDILKPVIVRPDYVRPILVRAEYDNRCNQYVATSLLPGGLNLNYTDTGVVKYDFRGTRNLALAQQMIAKADAEKGTPGFTMTARELVKLNSQECSCGNGINTANTPVIVRR